MGGQEGVGAREQEGRQQRSGCQINGEKSLIKFFEIKKKELESIIYRQFFPSLPPHTHPNPNHSLSFYTVKSPQSGKETSLKDLKGFKKLTFWRERILKTSSLQTKVHNDIAIRMVFGILVCTGIWIQWLPRNTESACEHLRCPDQHCLGFRFVWHVLRVNSTAAA